MKAKVIDANKSKLDRQSTQSKQTVRARKKKDGSSTTESSRKVWSADKLSDSIRKHRANAKPSGYNERWCFDGRISRNAKVGVIPLFSNCKIWYYVGYDDKQRNK
jgi:hypothetical protein